MDYEWSTPKAFFEKWNSYFHFQLDACATARNTKCRRYYTRRDDGLKRPWNGRTWVNPPYDRQLWRWVKKGYETCRQGNLVVMLLPASTDSSWFHRWCKGKGEIEFVRGRLTFSKTGRASFASMIVIFRPRRS
jgi:site-specific DNA-methyltransferase (adenine-specific)